MKNFGLHTPLMAELIEEIIEHLVDDHNLDQITDDMLYMDNMDIGNLKHFVVCKCGKTWEIPMGAYFSRNKSSNPYEGIEGLRAFLNCFNDHVFCKRILQERREEKIEKQKATDILGTISSLEI